MKQTPLYNQHAKAGAKFTGFGGYEMPVSYGVIKEEWQAVREKAGLFDISHMLPIRFSHENPQEIVKLLNYVCCRENNKLESGKVIYNAIINEKGGVIDDVTIYRLSSTKYMLIANAGNRDTVTEYLNRVAKDQQSTVAINPEKNYVLLALQGPDAFNIIKSFYQIPEIYFYETATVSQKPEVIISRTGYSGEDGCEILLDEENGKILFQKLVDNGIKLCGLAARDLLRLEAFYPLYGHELAESLNPFESGIGRIVNNKDSIAGESLVNLSLSTMTTTGFFLESEGIPRQNFAVFCEGEKVGEVTSGGFSFLWNKGFGMCRIKKDVLSKKLNVDIRGTLKAIVIAEKSPLEGSIARRPKKK